MNTVELYKLILEGRAYNSICCGFGFLTLIFAIITAVVFCVEAEFKGNKVSFKYTIYSSIVTILFLGVTTYFSFQANSRPKIDDMKVVIPIKLGEDIINNPQVKEAIDKAINLIPDKNTNEPKQERR